MLALVKNMKKLIWGIAHELKHKITRVDTKRYQIEGDLHKNYSGRKLFRVKNDQNQFKSSSTKCKSSGKKQKVVGK